MRGNAYIRLLFFYTTFDQILNIIFFYTNNNKRGDFMQKDIKIPKKKDTTKYGEFVCSTHHWLPIEKQKEQAERLANLTNDDKK